MSEYLTYINHPESQRYAQLANEYHTLCGHIASNGAYLPTLNASHFDD